MIRRIISYVAVVVFVVVIGLSAIPFYVAGPLVVGACVVLFR